MPFIVPAAIAVLLAAADVAPVEHAAGAAESTIEPLPPLAPAGVTPDAAEPLPPIEPAAGGATGRRSGSSAEQPFLPAAPQAVEPVRPAAVTFAGALGFAIPSGEVVPGEELADFTKTQVLIGLEGALRLMPELQLGLLLDVQFGSPGPVLQNICDAAGTTCTAAAVNLGVFARYAFTPLARQTPWVAVGVATGILDAEPDDPDLQGFAYGGNQLLRLSAGYDFRGSGQLGIGLFGTAAFGRYTDLAIGDGPYEPLGRTARHAWIQLGVRAILFP